ncbi:MAG: flagellar biosynthesis protein FlhB [Rhodospirillaceae bacterium]|jgi:flagellar biosynthesis protein FlhB|nr:flagellar biosynthesis protein FlhB [Rhodospirillaceae bacterium]MBT5245487.1 flagellar biosynthesis protein FlhB [Rhodospirillaceae bacterium]MBT5560969.1 flagellar biosynthesis protein FlhB [Rhodospirillaceae bacterium]MBT6240605.1 flagellar biosynthesis protein FlhB [Rhodospirillaceae bacterium]MBT7137930.1 flagellar biosynthesis protein FlhB [Rhodospirillaceae bacterium]
MADEDDAQKTEDPTDKRKEKSRSDGQVASSQEIKSWMSLLGGAFGLLILAPGIATDIRMIGAKFIFAPEAVPLDREHFQLLFFQVFIDISMAIGPFLMLLVLLAFVANVAQTGFIWAPKKIAPDVSKISLLKGAKRMFSLRSVNEFAKGILKLTLVTVVGLTVAGPFMTDMSLFLERPLSAMLDRLLTISVWFTLASVGVMAVIASLDFAYQKYSQKKEMMMSKQEVKDESKQSEGDPQVKARIRQIRMERAQQRMMASVPDADVVITNPTHYAIALKYKMADMTAPVLVAKGVDTLAMKIREVADENDIPIVENPPLARALYASVELDEEVPEEHYMAVAEVIGYVMRMRGDLPPQQVIEPGPQ